MAVGARYRSRACWLTLREGELCVRVMSQEGGEDAVLAPLRRQKQYCKHLVRRILLGTLRVFFTTGLFGKSLASVSKRVLKS